MRVLTGIKPTNILHIGNLFSGLLPAVQLQQEHEVLMMVADLHAITVTQKPEDLRANITFAVAAYLAAGIDPKKTVLFQQSQVPAHAELGWMIECNTRIGEAERMTQYKDKATGKGENVSVGLLTYPMLMAADILLYGTEAVPVGADQKQHLELARDVAERLNRDFATNLTLPKPLIREEGARIMSLDDPTVKMSKSSPSEKSYISLTDDAATVEKKIRSAVTDSTMGITLSDDRPGVKNLLTLHALCTGKTAEEIAAQFAESGMKDFKEATAVAISTFLAPLQERLAANMENTELLRSVLAEGSARARELAAPRISTIKQHMGLTL
jgi:tryptophanyl-tRNA synthetase